MENINRVALCKRLNLTYKECSLWNEVAADLQKAMKEAKQAQMRVDHFKDQLISLSNKENTCGDVYYFQQIERSGSVDYTAIPMVQAIVQTIDIELYRKPSSRYWKLEEI